jgi:hypothetical protein
MKYIIPGILFLFSPAIFVWKPTALLIEGMLLAMLLLLIGAGVAVLARVLWQGLRFF